VFLDGPFLVLFWNAESFPDGTGSAIAGAVAVVDGFEAVFEGDFRSVLHGTHHTLIVKRD